MREATDSFAFQFVVRILARRINNTDLTCEQNTERCAIERQPAAICEHDAHV
jgi:hypothetical protein